jgi:hypothetical protein
MSTTHGAITHTAGTRIEHDVGTVCRRTTGNEP